MTDSSSGSGLKVKILGGLVAGAVSLFVLLGLSSANVGSSAVRVVLAIVVGVVVAQVFERKILS